MKSTKDPVQDTKYAHGGKRSRKSVAQIIFNLKRIHVGVGSGEYGKYYHHLVISDFPFLVFEISDTGESTGVYVLAEFVR